MGRVAISGNKYEVVNFLASGSDDSVGEEARAKVAMGILSVEEKAVLSMNAATPLYKVVNKWAGILHGLNALLMILFYYSQSEKEDVCFNYTENGFLIPMWNGSYRKIENATASTSWPHGISLHYLIFFFHLLSFVFQIALEWPFGTAYENWVSKGRNPVRFVEYSISASLMVAAIALLSDVPSTSYLWNIVLLCAITQLFGAKAEALHTYGRQDNGNEEINDYSSSARRSDRTSFDSYWDFFSTLIFIVIAIAFVLMGTNRNGLDADGYGAKTFFMWVIIALFGLVSLSPQVLQKVLRFLRQVLQNVLRFLRQLVTRDSNWVGLSGVDNDDYNGARDALFAFAVSTFIISYGTIFRFYVKAVTSIEGDEEVPWFVHVTVFSMCLLFGCFGVVQTLQFYTVKGLLCKCGKGDTSNTEKAYAGCCERSVRRPNVNDRLHRFLCIGCICWRRPFSMTDNESSELLYTFLSLIAKTLLGWFLYATVLTDVASPTTCDIF
jgi:hypothetical protein